MFAYKLLFGILLVIRTSVYALPDTQPLRIVSLTPSNTAMVRDLGISNHLIGITKFCARPDDATGAVITGTMTHPNLEQIAALQPSLILGNVESNRIESLDKIESLGLPLVRLGPTQSLQEIIRDFKHLASLTNRKAAADIIIEKVTRHLAEIEAAVSQYPKKKAFAEIWPKPLTTVSSQGFIHHVIDTAGGSNIMADAPVPYPQISLESVLAAEPEVVLILTHSLIDDERIKRYREYPQFQHAIIHQTDDSELSQPSLSAFVHAVEHFARVIHPGIHIPTLKPVYLLLKDKR